MLVVDAGHGMFWRSMGDDILRGIFSVVWTCLFVIGVAARIVGRWSGDYFFSTSHDFSLEHSTGLLRMLKKIPQHVAVVCDGKGERVTQLSRILRICSLAGVEYITVFDRDGMSLYCSFQICSQFFVGLLKKDVREVVSGILNCADDSHNLFAFKKVLAGGVDWEGSFCKFSVPGRF